MKIPGVYVEIKGDLAQLKKDMTTAKQYVTEQSRAISDSLNNALSGQQVKGKTNALIQNFNTLKNAAALTGKEFANVGVDLKEMQRLTGLADKQFAGLQSKMLQTQAAKAQENSLKAIAKSAGLTDREIQKLGKQFGLSKKQIENITGANKKAEKSFFTMGNAVKAGLAYFSVTQLSYYGKELIAVADRYALVNSKIKLVTSGAAEFNEVYDRLFAISQNTGSSFESNAANFANLRLALRDTNFTTDDTIKLFDSVTKSLVVAGATTQESSSFMLQFRQAMGSGKLAGDEFRGMMESNSYWGGLLAKALDTDVAGLREMSKAGELTTDVIMKAFPKMAKQIESDFASIDKTVQRSMQELRNALGDVVNQTNSATEGTSKISSAISNLATAIHENREALSDAFSGLIEGAEKAVEVIANVSRSFSGWKAVSEGKLGFLEFATMNAKDLSEWLQKDKAGIVELQGQLETVRNQIFDTQNSWGLWGDKQKTLTDLRAEESRLLSEIATRTDAARVAAEKEAVAVAKTTNAIAARSGSSPKAYIPSSAGVSAPKIDTQKTKEDIMSLGDAWKVNAEKAAESDREIQKSNDLLVDQLNANQAAVEGKNEDSWYHLAQINKEYNDDVKDGTEETGGAFEELWAKLVSGSEKTSGTLTSTFGSWAGDLMDNKFDSIGDAWDSLWKGMLKALVSTLAEMAAAWAASEIASIAMETFHKGTGIEGVLKKDEGLAIVQEGEIIIDRKTSDRMRNESSHAGYKGGEIDMSGLGGQFSLGLLGEYAKDAAVGLSLSPETAAASMASASTLSGNVGSAGVKTIGDKYGVDPTQAQLGYSIGAMVGALTGMGTLGAVAMGSLSAVATEVAMDALNARALEALKEALEDRYGEIAGRAWSGVMQKSFTPEELAWATRMYELGYYGSINEALSDSKARGEIGGLTPGTVEVTGIKGYYDEDGHYHSRDEGGGNDTGGGGDTGYGTGDDGMGGEYDGLSRGGIVRRLVVPKGDDGFAALKLGEGVIDADTMKILQGQIRSGELTGRGADKQLLDSILSALVIMNNRVNQQNRILRAWDKNGMPEVRV